MLWAAKRKINAQLTIFDIQFLNGKDNISNHLAKIFSFLFSLWLNIPILEHQKCRLDTKVAFTTIRWTIVGQNAQETDISIHVFIIRQRQFCVLVSPFLNSSHYCTKFPISTLDIHFVSWWFLIWVAQFLCDFTIWIYRSSECVISMCGLFVCVCCKRRLWSHLCDECVCGMFPLTLVFVS